MRKGITALAILRASAGLASSVVEFATLTGRVTDSAGGPLDHTSVIVYLAGVKMGYSTYCPSCYADCGKRVFSDAAGRFTIKNLNPDLWFKILFVRDGYIPAFVDRVDSSKGPARTVAMSVRTAIQDPGRVVCGRVTDSHGVPVRDAVVNPQGVLAVVEGRGRAAMYGAVEGLEPIAVINSRGEFEIGYLNAAVKMLLLIEARGLAPKLVTLSTGGERQTVTVFDGAIIRGRLVDKGKPVANAEIGLIGRNRGFGPELTVVGNPYSEIRIGTQEDGSFVMTNVPAPAEWYIYGKMESIAARGATDALECATTADNQEVNVGDFQIKPGHRLHGKVILSDGKAVPEGSRIIIGDERAWDSQTVILGGDGRFEFVGLGTGRFEINPAAKGYPVQRKIEVSIDRDIDALVITLDPANRGSSKPWTCGMVNQPCSMPLCSDFAQLGGTEFLLSWKIDGRFGCAAGVSLALSKKPINTRFPYRDLN